MKVVIIDTAFEANVIGFSGIAINKDYAGTAFRLMDKMWKAIKQEQIKHKGQNIWVYEPGEKVFAGVEPEDTSQQNTAMEQKSISLKRYAYYKHIGPYQLIKQAGEQMRSELKSIGLEASLPYVEIYGHWTNDETKLTTELLMSIK